MLHAYPCKLTPSVTFPDVPEAMAMAEDALLSLSRP